MNGVDLLNQKTAAYKLDRKSSGGHYYVRLFFELMDISDVNSHAIYKVLYPWGMELHGELPQLKYTCQSCVSLRSTFS